MNKKVMTRFDRFSGAGVFCCSIAPPCSLSSQRGGTPASGTSRPGPRGPCEAAARRRPALLCRLRGIICQCMTLTANTIMIAALREPMTASGTISLRYFIAPPSRCVRWKTLGIGLGSAISRIFLFVLSVEPRVNWTIVPPERMRVPPAPRASGDRTANEAQRPANLLTH